MKNKHPTIILNYVPGGCMGLFQPCDVRIQCIFKHSLKQSYHADIVWEVAKQLDQGKKNILIDK
jgi:hypothetical protein